MTGFQRPGGPRRARRPEQLPPGARPPSDAQRAAGLAMAQDLLKDDETTSVSERNPYDFRDEQPNPPRAAPAVDWAEDAAHIEDVEPALDVHDAEVSAEAHSEVLVSPEAMGAGAVGEEVGAIVGGLIPEGSIVHTGTLRIVETETQTSINPGKINITGASVLSGRITDPLSVLSEAIDTGTAPTQEVVEWAKNEIERLRSLPIPVLPRFNTNMTLAPTDGKVIIAVGRYADAKRGFPRMVHWSSGAWREIGRTVGEPLICWAWLPREVLGAWPEEP